MPKIKMIGEIKIEETSVVSEEDYQLVLGQLEHQTKRFEDEIKRDVFDNDNNVKVKAKLRIEVLD